MPAQPDLTLPAKEERPAKDSRRPGGRWWLLVLAVILGAVGWLSLAPITSRVEAAVVQQLNVNGVYPRYQKRSWVPWRGLSLEGVTLYRNARGNEPVIEVSTLSVTFPWRNIWRTRHLISHWRANGALVKLHDSAGVVTFQNVSTKVTLEPGRVDVSSLQANNGPVAWALQGNILFKADQDKSAPKGGDFTVDLSVVRAVQESLDIKPRTGPFHIAGNFSIDLQQSPVIPWQAQLTGNGKSLEWHGVPLREAAVEAQLTSSDLHLSANLQLATGTATLTASRKDWDKAPLLIAGRLADDGGRKDSIAGSYDGAARALTLSSVRGNANLLAFARNFPAVVPYLPTTIRMTSFPEVELKNFAFREGKSGPDWSLGSLELLSPADLTLTLRTRPLTINRLTGRAAFKGHTWQLTGMSGNLFGGHFTLSGAYADGDLRQARVELAGLKMKEVGPWIDARDATLDAAVLSLDYHGTLSASPAHLTGSGGVRLENAPVVKVPLLDETYALFSAFSPNVQRKGVGHLKSTFSATNGVFDITDFTAHSEAITVTGTGTVDLVRRKVDGRAEGHLRGVVGIVTSPITKALEMKVSGPLDQIQVQPMGPVGIVGGSVSGAAQLPAKALKEGVKLPGHLLEKLIGPGATPEPRAGQNR
ncbi:MAG: AsmA-like C-terminal region-containing protein [Chthoniobacter sp.]|uniref:AsmA-like C-terminal region-containing protein n=1 Tax=Chthoniobacter sp. TaxID=2510640 RepID=UPI0032A62643